jgi:hypothetical protein
VAGDSLTGWFPLSLSYCFANYRPREVYFTNHRFKIKNGGFNMKKIMASLLIWAILILTAGTFSGMAYIGNDGSIVDADFTKCTAEESVFYANGGEVKAALNSNGANYPWWNFGMAYSVAEPSPTAVAGFVSLSDDKFGGQKALKVERKYGGDNWQDIGVRADINYTPKQGEIVALETTLLTDGAGYAPSDAPVFLFEALEGNGASSIFRIYGKSGRYIAYKANGGSEVNSSGGVFDNNQEMRIKMFLNLSAGTADYEVTLSRGSSIGSAWTGVSLQYADGVQVIKNTAPISIGSHSSIYQFRFGRAGYNGAVYFKDVKMGVLKQENTDITYDFKNDISYAGGLNSAQLAAEFPKWNIHNGSGSVRVAANEVYMNTSTTDKLPSSLLIGPMTAGNADNPFVEIPIAPQNGVVQIEYTYLGSGNTQQPYFEVYSGMQKRLGINSSWRNIYPLSTYDQTVTSAGNAISSNPDNSNDPKIFKYQLNSYPILFRYLIDFPNKKYNLYVKNDEINENTLLSNGAVYLGNNTIAKRDIPLFGAHNDAPIDKIKFGGTYQNAEFTLGIQNLKIMSVPAAVTEVSFTDGDSPAPLESFNASTELKANFAVENNLGVPSSVSLAIAVYDSENRLMDIQIQKTPDIAVGRKANVSIAAGSLSELSGTGHYAKAFAWETLDGMSPVRMDDTVRNKTIINQGS